MIGFYNISIFSSLNDKNLDIFHWLKRTFNKNNVLYSQEDCLTIKS